MNYQLPRSTKILFAMYFYIKDFARKFDDFGTHGYYLDLAYKCYNAALALDDELWFN